ncbi:MAG: restriction endonuclease [Chloroflexi bacterium]|nr:restriction endonuclease [Chloroflexota bacterium]
MAQATRTVNPLHFEDLEPHRFEDLVRQLIYDYRPWKTLEATGRAGGDEGVDIRAVERMSLPSSDEIAPHDEALAVTEEIEPGGRLWIIQCKRELQIGPSKIRGIVADNLSGLADKPYGYVLVAACNFSKKARDAFREEVLKYGVEEFDLWGKEEVEDQLYLPKNDHLLFAYFGISLQVRRRSLKTETRARLSLKKRLTDVLGAIDIPGHESVLIRDPRDEQYPYIKASEDFVKAPRWRYWRFYGHEPPDHLAFVYKQHFAYVNLETKEYDILPGCDEGVPQSYMPEEIENAWRDPKNLAGKYREYWWNKVPEENRAEYIEVRIIPYERIIAVDDIGDKYYRKPHLLVEYENDGQPFKRHAKGQFIEQFRATGRNILDTCDCKRISYFPDEILK